MSSLSTSLCIISCVSEWVKTKDAGNDLTEDRTSCSCKFGEDILNHSRAITSGKFSVWQFWPWTMTLASQKLIVRLKFHENGFLLLEKSLLPPCYRTNEHDRLQYLLRDIIIIIIIIIMRTMMVMMMMIQRYNAVAILGTFAHATHKDEIWPFQLTSF